MMTNMQKFAAANDNRERRSRAESKARMDAYTAVKKRRDSVNQQIDRNRRAFLPSSPEVFQPRGKMKAPERGSPKSGYPVDMSGHHAANKMRGAIDRMERKQKMVMGAGAAMAGLGGAAYLYDRYKSKDQEKKAHLLDLV